MLLIINSDTLIRVPSGASFMVWLYEVLSTLCPWRSLLLQVNDEESPVGLFIPGHTVQISLELTGEYFASEQDITSPLFQLSLFCSLTFCSLSSGLLTNNDFDESIPLDAHVLWIKGLIPYSELFLFLLFNREPIFLCLVILQGYCL